MKYCSKCKITKENKEFNKHKGHLNGLYYCCKICQKEYKKIYYQNNKDYIIKKIKEYRKLNIEKVKKQQKLSREHRLNRIPNYNQLSYKKYKTKILIYQKKNREKINTRHYQRLKEDINYRLRRYLRTRLWQALKTNVKSSSAIKLIGCSVEQLKNHLQFRFTTGMTWSNYGKWHIDHIKPCASFDLTKPEEQKKCFNYTNLQSLWAIDNYKKRDKYEKI